MLQLCVNDFAEEWMPGYEASVEYVSEAGLNVRANDTRWNSKGGVIQGAKSRGMNDPRDFLAPGAVRDRHGRSSV